MFVGLEFSLGILQSSMETNQSATTATCMDRLTVELLIPAQHLFNVRILRHEFDIYIDLTSSIHLWTTIRGLYLSSVRLASSGLFIMAMYCY